MSADENFLKILEKLTEVQVEVGSVKAEVSHMKEDIHDIKEEDKKQNALLAEHIKGVQTNSQRLEVEIEARKDQHQQTIALIESHKQDNDEEFKKVKEETLADINKRLDEVEFLPKLASMLRKAVLWIGAPAGALYAIGRIAGWF